MQIEEVLLMIEIDKNRIEKSNCNEIYRQTVCI